MAGKQCEYCNKTGKGMRCGGCQSVFYCSKTCQRSDWTTHKKQCQNSKTGPQTLSSTAANTAEHKICHCCSNSENLKVCSRCKAASYCSTSCQKNDWAEHKRQCTSSSHNTEKNAKSPRLSRCSTNGAKATPQGDLGMSNEEMLMLYDGVKFTDFATGMKSSFFAPPTSNPAHFQCSDVGLGWYKEMQAKASRLFPRLTVVTNLKVVSYYPAIGSVMVLRISHLHPYVYRHVAILQDCNGNEVPIFFYIQTEPEPYFHWDDLLPGNYICYINPRLHNFADGQTGFRIDQRDEIRILKH